MGKLILFVNLLLVTINCHAQDSVAQPVSVINGTFTDFNVDQNGNIYVVADQQLKKLSSAGDSLAVYNDVRRFGKISSIDVSNPLKLVLFYKGSGTVVLLDRFLAVLTTIDLRKSKITTASAVRLAYDNNIWVYDEVDNRIKKLNDAGKVLFESLDLRQVFDTAPSVSQVYDDNRTLYLYDCGTGWYLFDYYGALVKRKPFTGWSNAQVVNGTMAGVQNNALLTARTADPDYHSTRLYFPASSCIRVLFNDKRTYALFADGLKIYPAP